jgi:hypothetical protein
VGCCLKEPRSPTAVGPVSTRATGDRAGAIEPAPSARETLQGARPPNLGRGGFARSPARTSTWREKMRGRRGGVEGSATAGRRGGRSENMDSRPASLGVGEGEAGRRGSAEGFFSCLAGGGGRRRRRRTRREQRLEREGVRSVEGEATCTSVVGVLLRCFRKRSIWGAPARMRRDQ